MVASKLARWSDYGILGLTVFLIFCLWFEPYLAIPPFLEWMGRWHPLILHFPIVLLLFVAVYGFLGKSLPRYVVPLAVILTLVTAITGFFLGSASGKGEVLVRHQWLGSGLAIVAVLWYWMGKRRVKPIFSRVVSVVLVFLVILTGHYGGMVTHGNDFLAFPRGNETWDLPENPELYPDVVQVILDRKCVSCHNPDKRKGGLALQDHASLMTGGEDGPVVVIGDSEGSELIKRMQLPLEDEDHMPPEGKSQLTETEIAILARWIAIGASETMRINDLPPQDPMAALVQGLTKDGQGNSWTDLPVVADSTLTNLSTDYITVRRVSDGSNAIAINAYNPPSYDAAPLLALQRIAPNIVYLDLSGLPLQKETFGMIAAFPNLEWLELDGTTVGDKEISQLKTLQNLALIKLYDTSVGDAGLRELAQFPHLKKIYLWDAQVSAQAIADFIRDHPSTQVDTGNRDVLPPPADSIPSTKKDSP